MITRTRTAGLALPALVWLFPLVFVLHDGEEIITTASWVAAHQDLLAGTPFGGVSVTTSQMTVAVLVVFLLVLLGTYAGLRALRRGRFSLLFGAALGMMFLNIFTHLGQSIMAGGYTPGIATAPTILLPYTLYVYRRLFQAGLLTWRQLGLSLALGVVVAVPLLAAAHGLGQLMFPTGM